MSIRGYKIIKIEIEKEPSFDCRSSNFLLNYVSSDYRNGDGSGTVEFAKEELEAELKRKREHYIATFETSDKSLKDFRKQRINAIKRLLRDFKKGEKYISYECY